MSEPAVLGIRPWLPWPLSRLAWWTAPVRAERLGAIRIGLAAMLLLDVCLTYLPGLDTFYAIGGLGSPELYAYTSKAPRWHWSILRTIGEQHYFQTNYRDMLWFGIVAWQLALVLLLFGIFTRVAAVAAWALSISFSTLNPDIENAGDQVRGIILFYLMLCPCGAAWSLDSWLRRRKRPDTEPAYVHPWPLRLLFVQMALIYCMNGLYKLKGDDWPAGDSLYYVLADVTLSRWSYAQWPIPYPITRVMTWTVLTWEVSFPLLVAVPWLVYHLTRPFSSRRWVDRRRQRQLKVAGAGFSTAA